MALVLADKQCFSHGQLYVAMSRVTSIDGIRVFSPHTRRDGVCTIDNIVFYELLQKSPQAIPSEARAQNSDGYVPSPLDNEDDMDI